MVDKGTEENHTRRDIVQCAADGIESDHDKEIQLCEYEAALQGASGARRKVPRKRNAVHVRHVHDAERPDEVDGAEGAKVLEGLRHRGRKRQATVRRERVEDSKQGHPEDPAPEQDEGGGHAIVDAAFQGALVLECGGGRAAGPHAVAAPRVVARAESVNVDNVERCQCNGSCDFAETCRGPRYAAHLLDLPYQDEPEEAKDAQAADGAEEHLALEQTGAQHRAEGRCKVVCVEQRKRQPCEGIVHVALDCVVPQHDKHAVLHGQEAEE